MKIHKEAYRHVKRVNEALVYRTTCMIITRPSVL